MVLVLDGTSEIDAHVRRNLYYLISSRHLNRLSEKRHKSDVLFLRKDLFTTFSELPSNRSTMVKTI